ncbi:MAG: GLUG motif-containing protein, partial [Acutalibacteraceae bacterium]
MNLTKKREINLFRRALAVLLTTLLMMNPISPIFTPKEVNAQENSDVKYLSEVDLSGTTVGSSWENKYDTTFYDTINSNYSSNYGSEDTALQISNAAQLAAFAKAVNEGKDFSGKYVELTKDIDLQGTNLTVTETDDGTDKFKVVVSGNAENVWVPIGTDDNPFKGNFDGGNFEVKNMTVLVKQDSSDVYAGLFGKAYNCTIQNTGVSGSVYVSNSYHASFVTDAGGLVGLNDGSSVSNSYATSSIYVSSNYTGEVNGYFIVASAGGLVGSNKGSIDNSYATGSVYCSTPSSYSIHSVYAGGLSGSNNNSIRNSYATGCAYASSSSSYKLSSYAGGLVGRNSGSISNSYATGSAYCSSLSYPYSYYGIYAGGLIGYNSGSISNSYATGSVHASYFSTSSSSITSGSYDGINAGGLIGYNSGSISNSYATGSVYASYSSYNYGINAGGLVGYNYESSSISNSYATGSVYTSTQSSYGVSDGGLVGRNSGSISNSYATGSVHASSFGGCSAGGLVGYNYNDNGTVTNSYYNSESTIKGVETPTDIGTALTREQMTGITGGVDGRAEDKMEGFSTDNWTFTEDEGRIRYFPRLKEITYGESNPAPYYEVGLPTPTADDFTFTEPSDLTYNGTPKEATVTTKDGITGMGEITINYYDISGPKLDSAPTDAGTYKVKIDVTEGDNYNAGTNITADSWTFTIEKATPTADDFTFTELSDLTYDGTAKVATVTAKDGITGMGEITINYYDISGPKLDSAPKDAGTYKVKINVTEGTNYEGSKAEIEDVDWTFIIGKATPSVPTGLTGIYGQTLSEIELPSYDGIGTWYWNFPNTLIEVGVKVYLAHFISTSDNYKGIANAELTINGSKATPTADDFTFTPPSDLTYDGNSKEAKVISNKAGIGTITVNYYNSVGTKLESAPTDAGTYKVKISVTEGDNYNANQEITADDWTFTIEKATLSAPTGLTGIYGQTLSDIELPDNWEWAESNTKLEKIGEQSFYANYTGDDKSCYEETENIKIEVYVNCKSIESDDIEISGVNVSYDYDGTTGSIQPTVTVKDGDAELTENTDYEVSYKYGGWPGENGKIKGTVIILGMGNYDGKKTIEFDITDKVAPSGTIYMDDNENIAFSVPNNKVNFEYVFKEAKHMKIDASDNESGIAHIYYHISEEVKAVEEITDNDWKEYTEGKSIELSNGTKSIIYAKIEDNNGNVKYINSQGIIVYNAVEAEEEVFYTKAKNEDVKIVTDLKENTINKICLDGSTNLAENEHYTISEEDTKSVSLNCEYLNSLSAGEHSLTILYNPMGEKFDDRFMEGDNPEIEIKLTIEKATPTADDFDFTEPSDLTYDGNSKEAKVTSDKEGMGTITIKYYNALEMELESAPTDAGTYKVKIGVTEGENYNANQEITADDWTFTIEKATPTADDFDFTEPSD